MKYVLAAVNVSDQEQLYYDGPKRKIPGPRTAYKVTPFVKHAATFGTREEAEAMCKELDDGYNVVEMDGD